MLGCCVVEPLRGSGGEGMPGTPGLKPRAIQIEPFQGSGVFVADSGWIVVLI